MDLKLIPSEYEECRAFHDYCIYNNLDIVHIPNEGKRSFNQGRKLKRIGMRKGYPDFQLNKMRNGFGGLFIEMKNKKGKLSNDQKWWLKHLTNEGYKAVVCYGSDEAIKAVNEYLGLS